jgi:hypothetical protein
MTLLNNNPQNNFPAIINKDFSQIVRGQDESFNN